MVNSVYLTQSCRDCRLCLYTYFLKFCVCVCGFFLYAICQRPSRHSVPQSARHVWICLQRSWDAPGGPALPEGGHVRVAPGRAWVWGLSLMECRVRRTGALAALRDPGRQGPMQSSFFQLSYCVSSGPTTTRRDPFHIHQDRNPGAVPEPPVGTLAFQRGAQDSTRLCPRSRCHTPMITGFIPLRTGIPLL